MIYRGIQFYLIESEQTKKSFSIEESNNVAEELEINFDDVTFDEEQFNMGINIELEHGRRSPETNITDDDPIMTGKIALAHLNEIPDYYTRLDKMEKEAKENLIDKQGGNEDGKD